jgi:hypothetical protein
MNKADVVLVILAGVLAGIAILERGKQRIVLIAGASLTVLIIVVSHIRAYFSEPVGMPKVVLLALLALVIWHTIASLSQKYRKTTTGKNDG